MATCVPSQAGQFDCDHSVNMPPQGGLGPLTYLFFFASSSPLSMYHYQRFTYFGRRFSSVFQALQVKAMKPSKASSGWV
jgi:hypothetical protein